MTKFRRAILAGISKAQGSPLSYSAIDIRNDDFNALHGVMELLSVDVRAISGGLVKFGHFADPDINGYLDVAEQKSLPARFPLALVAIDDSKSIEVGVLTTNAKCFPLTVSFIGDGVIHVISASNDVELTNAIGRLVSGAKFAEALLSLIDDQQNIVRH